jgi:hypothetical protein
MGASNSKGVNKLSELSKWIPCRSKFSYIFFTLQLNFAKLFNTNISYRRFPSNLKMYRNKTVNYQTICFFLFRCKPGNIYGRQEI